MQGSNHRVNSKVEMHQRQQRRCFRCGTDGTLEQEFRNMDDLPTEVIPNREIPTRGQVPLRKEEVEDLKDAALLPDSRRVQQAVAKVPIVYDSRVEIELRTVKDALSGGFEAETRIPPPDSSSLALLCRLHSSVLLKRFVPQSATSGLGTAEAVEPPLTASYTPSSPRDRRRTGFQRTTPEWPRDHCPPVDPTAAHGSR